MNSRPFFDRGYMAPLVRRNEDARIVKHTFRARTPSAWTLTGQLSEGAVRDCFRMRITPQEGRICQGSKSRIAGLEPAVIGPVGQPIWLPPAFRRRYPEGRLKGQLQATKQSHKHR